LTVSTIAPSRIRSVLVWLTFGGAALRFALAVFSAVHFNQGDFFATMPGVYAEQWNLTLWDSPDLDNSERAYRHGYLYGPTQYLTLWPVVFLDSYHRIAAVLLWVYVLLIIATAYAIWRLCETLVPVHGVPPYQRAMTVFAAVLLFGPLQAAMGQREFETVQTVMIALAVYFVARRQAAVAGAILGYISMFKYWPLALFGYFIAKRQARAVGAFLLSVAAVLLLAHAVFDLERFLFASAAGIAGQIQRVQVPVGSAGSFCAEVTGTAANLRAGLCGIVGGRHAVAQGLYFSLCAAGAGVFLVIFAMFERRRSPVDELDDRWRQVIEVCLFLLAAGVVIHGHYYYLSVLIIPLTLVLYEALWVGRPGSAIRGVLALFAYAALSPFVIPIALVARVTGGDPWMFYLSHGIYAYGIAILAGLLFWRYLALLRRAGRAVSQT
jgi:hypothetical protein